MAAPISQKIQRMKLPPVSPCLGFNELPTPSALAAERWKMSVAGTHRSVKMDVTRSSATIGSYVPFRERVW